MNTQTTLWEKKGAKLPEATLFYLLIGLDDTGTIVMARRRQTSDKAPSRQYPIFILRCFSKLFPLLVRYLLFQIFQSSAANFCNFLSVLQLVALMVAVKDTKDNTLSLFFFFSFFPLLLCISSHTLSSAEPRRNCPIGENVWTAKESGRVFDPRWKLFASWQ